MRWLITLLSFTFYTALFAQGTVFGTITDFTSQSPLVGATVQSSTGDITTTDENGFYTLTFSSVKEVKLTFSYIGYTSKSTDVSFTSNEEIVLDIELKVSTSILNQIVVTSSQNEKKIENEPISIELIKPTFLARNNVTSLSDVMERVPGVQVIDDQITIRNSGYSFGAGSRVGIIVDGQPLLSAALSDIKWNFVPIENTSQIEVMKGASSVLYGSAAMNGVINVITAWPTATPRTEVTLYTGEWDTPKSAYRQWWDGETVQPGTQGVYLSHRSKGEKVDLVIGGNYHKTVGYLKDMNEDRLRFNWKTRYRLTDKINFGINGNVMKHNERRWLIWADTDTNALINISNDDYIPYRTFSIDPFINAYDNKGNKHELKGRLFSVTVDRPIGIPDSPAYIYSGEYSFKSQLNKTMKLTLGTSYQYMFGEDIRFRIDTSETLFQADATIAAVYGQWDANFLDDRLNIVFGLRGEYVNAGDSAYNAIIPVSRLSALYKLNDKSRLRFNTGQGYRIPSLIERFADSPILETGSTFLPTISLLPNPEILPEVGWSMEIGYKHLMKGGQLDGYIDIALFNMDYWNLSEVLFGYHGIPNTALDLTQVGFKTVSVSRGRIAGVEISSYMNWNNKYVPMRFWGGYTYTYPGDLDSIAAKNMSYVGNFFKAFNDVDEEVSATILRYRSLHTARLDMELNLKPLFVGFAANYNGYMHQIDDVFIGRGVYGELLAQLIGDELIPGFSDFRDETKKEGGSWVYDFRATLNIGKHLRFSFIVNNFSNREYSIRPGRMNAPRSFNFKTQIIF